MTRAELEQYARENRKRLEAQDVRLGDVVKVLKGQFVGARGLVIGVQALSKFDIFDPYYELLMDCDVPDKYRCRKSLLPSDMGGNIAGGFNKCDFEVIGNYKTISDD